MQASSWVEQECLDEKMAELEAHKAELSAQLQAVQAELAAARQAAAAQEVTLRKLSEQLLREGEAAIKLRAQLAKEQTLVKSLKAKTSKVRAVLSCIWLPDTRESTCCRYARLFATRAEMAGVIWSQLDTRACAA